VSQTARPVVFVAAASIVVAATDCATARRPPVNSYGVEACPRGAADALLSVDALQCWFTGRHGRWRLLSQESHFDVLVVHAEAFDLRDAQEIAQQFVRNQRAAFSEILIYVQPESTSAARRIRRVQWTRNNGSETIDFEDPTSSATAP
jgi:hypothetical protein